MKFDVFVPVRTLMMVVETECMKELVKDRSLMIGVLLELIYGLEVERTQRGHFCIKGKPKRRRTFQQNEREKLFPKYSSSVNAVKRVDRVC